MFGTFRVILAILVLLSHISVSLVFNCGAWAVINFFMISGYVMTFLIRNNYGKIGVSTWYFYIDRFLRIYPQYLLFLVLTQIADLNWYLKDVFLQSTPTLWKFFLNALIVPVNYFMFLPDSIGQYQLIPAAWSLGLEEQFYWIFPFLVLIPWLGRFTTAVSYITFCLAIFGILNTELFAIRFLPGVIFIFLLGKNLADYNLKKSEEAFWTLASLYVAILVLTVWLWLFRPDILMQIFVKEALSAILIGFPIMAFLSRLPRKRWDDILGNSSYGIFLCHMLVINTFHHFQIFSESHSQFIVAAILTSTALGFAGYYLVEKLVNPFRYALRKRHAQAISSLG